MPVSGNLSVALGQALMAAAHYDAKIEQCVLRPADGAGLELYEQFSQLGAAAYEYAALLAEELKMPAVAAHCDDRSTLILQESEAMGPALEARKRRSE